MPLLLLISTVYASSSGLREGILGHLLTKDSSLMLHAIHSLSTGGFLKKTRLYTVKKGSRVSRLQPGCHLPNSHWAGIIQL
jgi:hypothetical protein